MSLGLPEDPRRFEKPSRSELDLPKIPKEKKCHYCHMKITGKSFRIAEGKYVCFQCWSESMPSRTEGFWQDGYYLTTYYN